MTSRTETNAEAMAAEEDAHLRSILAVADEATGIITGSGMDARDMLFAAAVSLGFLNAGCHEGGIPNEELSASIASGLKYGRAVHQVAALRLAEPKGTA
jgi:hypothetical protein